LINNKIKGKMVNLTTFELQDCPTIEEGVRLLKTQYRSNQLRYRERFLKPLNLCLSMNAIRNLDGIIQMYDSLFERVKPYSYKEAFEIQNATFRTKVFSVIDVPEMIKNLGHTRIATEGIELVNKTWNQYKEEFEEINLSQVYELHEVNGSQLGINEPLYAIKCWCTSTNNEHWLWEDTKKSPLESIASCCMVYKKMVGKIEYIIRQGDVFLFGMKNGQEVEINEDDEVVALSKEDYFSLLISQS